MPRGGVLCSVQGTGNSVLIYYVLLRGRFWLLVELRAANAAPLPLLGPSTFPFAHFRQRKGLLIGPSPTSFCRGTPDPGHRMRPLPLGTAPPWKHGHMGIEALPTDCLGTWGTSGGNVFLDSAACQTKADGSGG